MCGRKEDARQPCWRSSQATRATTPIAASTTPERMGSIACVFRPPNSILNCAIGLRDNSDLESFAGKSPPHHFTSGRESPRSAPHLPRKLVCLTPAAEDDPESHTDYWDCDEHEPGDRGLTVRPDR